MSVQVSGCGCRQRHVVAQAENRVSETLTRSTMMTRAPGSVTPSAQAIAASFSGSERW
jgi:hypothetical protein